MPDGRKQILSPFTGCKKRKAWNKTREKGAIALSYPPFFIDDSDAESHAD